MGRALKKLDLFQRVPQDLTEATQSGALLSICAGLFMVLLFHVELFAFLVAKTETYVTVDNPQEQKMRITFNITMLDLPCEYATVDVLDVLGTNRMNVTKNIDKWHLDSQGLRMAYEGRNTAQRDIIQSDEAHVDLQALHANGIHAWPLSPDTYDTWLEEHPWTFVAYVASWCMWCQRLLPTWEALAEELERRGGHITVVRVDCVEHPELCMQQKIQAFPTLRLHSHGTPLNPDYREDRTVVAMAEWAEALVDSQKLRLGLELGGADKPDDDPWPGCVITGSLLVNRVPGNFHIEAQSKSHTFHAATTNLSHVVAQLSFGEPLMPRDLKKIMRLPEDLRQLSPLSGNAYMTDSQHQAPHHYIKVVGTTYQLGGHQSVKTYQMVGNTQMMHYDSEEIPEAKFSYQVSPMAVLVKKEGRRWYSFLTQVLAIIGGTFSLMGLIDGLLYTAKGTKRNSLR